MGYNTDFHGHVEISPPLDEGQVANLLNFADKCHDRVGSCPGGYCQWVPTDDGSALVWDGNEKFYDSVEWMKYLIDTFLKQNHTLNGEIEAIGEEADDRWMLVVKNNKVSTKQGRVVYDD